MIIRAMQLKDVEGVLNVEHLSFAIPWSEAAFQHEVTGNPFSRYYVLTDDADRVLAYAGMWIVIDEAHVTNIAVLPELRGHGWGKKLMQKLVEEADACGVLFMTLEVRVSNVVAQNLYSQFGFKYQTIRSAYYSDNHEDAMVLTKEWENR